VGDEARLAELVEAFGISLGRASAGFVATCPRCDDSLAADDGQWSCGCGSGGPVELVAVFGGLSMSLVAAGQIECFQYLHDLDKSNREERPPGGSPGGRTSTRAECLAAHRQDLARCPQRGAAKRQACRLEGVKDSDVTPDEAY
jgi:hypothetical protein